MMILASALMIFADSILKMVGRVGVEPTTLR